MTAIIPYIKIARPDNWTKNVFMIPGAALALFDNPTLVTWDHIPGFVIGLISLCLLASSNYVINEILDAPTDRFHPVKKKRPIPSGEVKIPLAYAEWILCCLAGLVLAWGVNIPFFVVALVYLVLAWAYNIPPVRLKDIPYADVLSESANNPIRLLMGWYAVGNLGLIMLSALLAYWMLGAFLMATKRFAEYVKINSKDLAVKYRKSFAYYNSDRLIFSIIYYASAFGLFAGIFIIRYQIELILGVPFIAGFFSYYLRIGFLEDSPVQYPEKLYQNKNFMIYTGLTAAIMIGLLFVKIPLIGEIFRGRPH